MDLVEVKKNEIFCDSSIVAKKFNQNHAEVVKRIKKLNADLDKYNVVSNHIKIIEENRIYKGRKYTAYLMNRDFFSLLAMRFRGKKALEWQVKFNNAFYQMEEKLLLFNTNKKDQKWIDTREQGKLIHKEETNIIKEFVEYATKQGSTHANYYYKHLTNASYKALGMIAHKKPNFRDTLNIIETSKLTIAEDYARIQIGKYMELGRNYKDIYQSVKEDLIDFASSLRIE